MNYVITMGFNPNKSTKQEDFLCGKNLRLIDVKKVSSVSAQKLRCPASAQLATFPARLSLENFSLNSSLENSSMRDLYKMTLLARGLRCQKIIIIHEPLKSSKNSLLLLLPSVSHILSRNMFVVMLPYISCFKVVQYKCNFHSQTMQRPFLTHLNAFATQHQKRIESVEHSVFSEHWRSLSCVFFKWPSKNGNSKNGNLLTNLFFKIWTFFLKLAVD